MSDGATVTTTQLLTPDAAAAYLGLPLHTLREFADRALLVPVVEDDAAGYRRDEVERFARARDAGDGMALTHEEISRALTDEIGALRAENATLRRQLAAARQSSAPALPASAATVPLPIQHPPAGGVARREPRLRPRPEVTLPAWSRTILAALRRALGRYSRLEIAACAAVLLIGLALRGYGLTSLPGGLHGDEGVTGLATQQILRDGPIGLYTGLANGMPTGTFYLTAIPIALFGHTIFGVRIFSVLVAMLTLPALYLIMRRPFGTTGAIIGAILLATMDWHIHFARIGFPVIVWPLCTLVTIGLLAEGMRRADWRWWAGAGAVAGLGVYIYNAHLLFLAILALILAGYVAWDTYYAHRQTLVRRFLLPAALAAGLLATTGPMIAFALAPGSDYFGRSQQVSFFSRPEWIAQQGTGNEVRFLAERYLGYWDQVCCHPVPDGADGTGIVPLAPLGLILLAVAGAALGLVYYRHPVIPMGIVVVLLIPLGSVITIDGLARRTLPVTPFLALFAALPLAALLDHARAHWRERGGQAWYAPLAGCAVALILLTNAYVNVDNYFHRFADSYENRWVFASELTAASEFMNDLPAGSHVYFFSDRWSFNYETRLYLAPGVAGEDRSTEYGKRTDLDIDEADRPAVYIFLGEYLTRLDEVRLRHPQGVVTIGRADGKTAFAAYSVAAR